MCGIAGFWRPDGLLRADANVLRAMTGRLHHRGPDDSGDWFDERVGIAIGHRRLAIVDTSSDGHQPMISARGRYVICLNGEIYNFRELRRELLLTDSHFRGSSDTEVALAAFEEWGIEASVKRFIGMFAIALWDRLQSTLYLIRDRLGEKPLYAGWMAGVLVFGSELKALTMHHAWVGDVDRGALSLFLRYAYVPQPWSIYEGIRKIIPGTIVAIRQGTSGPTTTETTYWSAR